MWLAADTALFTTSSAYLVCSLSSRSSYISCVPRFLFLFPLYLPGSPTYLPIYLLAFQLLIKPIAAL